MRQVPFDPERLDGEQKQWWEAWVARAAAVQKDLVDKRGRDEACDFDKSVWTELKNWLFANVFDNKCAYCEDNVRASSYGDGEHYRPKGNVTVKGESGKRRAVAGRGGRDHPGYYWLAYDWRNLLPCCDRCNVAKSDQFPVAGRHVHEPAPAPDALDRLEQPLLINPYLEDPGRHLVFGVRGAIAPAKRDIRGKATIEVLALDRKELVEARDQHQAAVGRGVGGSLGDYFAGKGDQGDFAAWIGPKAIFTAAIRGYADCRARIAVRQFLRDLHASHSPRTASDGDGGRAAD